MQNRRRSISVHAKDKNEICDREKGIIVCEDRDYTLGKAARAYLKYMSEKQL